LKAGQPSRTKPRINNRGSKKNELKELHSSKFLIMAASEPSDKKPPSIPQPGRPTRVLTSKPIDSPASSEEAAGADFRKNFPEADTGPVQISDAIKTIKAEDAFEVHKTVCGRQGFMTAMGTGAASGILRFIWKGTQTSHFSAVVASRC
jgi:hypothetical protein